MRVPATLPEFSEWTLLILFDDDIKDLVKVTNVQKCDVSQS